MPHRTKQPGVNAPADRAIETAQRRWPRSMRAATAAAYLDISVGLLLAEAKAGRAPKSFHLTRGAVAWLKDDIDDWLDEKAGRPERVDYLSGAEMEKAEAVTEWDRLIATARDRNSPPPATAATSPGPGKRKMTKDEARYQAHLRNHGR